MRAKGLYPVETVQMMHRICIEAEQSFFTTAHYNEVRILTTPENITETLACSAVSAAIEQDVSAIVVLTSSGLSARVWHIACGEWGGLDVGPARTNTGGTGCHDVGGAHRATALLFWVLPPCGRWCPSTGLAARSSP